MIADDYYSIAQAAKVVGVTRQTIYRWVNSGKLPVERVGREGIIPKESLPTRTKCPTCGSDWVKWG